MNRQNDFSRLLKTINCQEPDYVPVAELSVDKAVKEKFLGRPIANIKDDVDFWRQAGYDYIYLRPNYEYPGLPASVAVGTNLSREAEINSNEAASTLDNWRKIKTEKDMDGFPWPDPETIDYSNLEEAAKCLPE